MRRQRSARDGSRRFYSGRTTHTLKEHSQLKQQKQYRRQKLAQQKRRALLMKISGKLKWVGVALVALLGIYMLRIQSTQFVGLTGLSQADKDVILQLSDTYFSSGLRNYKTFFSEADFEDYISNQASFVASVEADTGILSPTLKVRIVPKKPIYDYRGISGNENTWVANDGSLISLTDEQIFEMGQEAPTAKITDLSDVDYREGDTIIALSTLEFLNQFRLEAALEGIEVNGYRIQSNPREAEAEIAGESYVLKLAVERPVRSILDDYIAIIETIDVQSIRRYVDLRVPDKAFYR